MGHANLTGYSQQKVRGWRIFTQTTWKQSLNEVILWETDDWILKKETGLHRRRSGSNVRDIEESLSWRL